MADALPVVRSFVLCDDVVTEPGPPIRISLIGLVSTIRAPGGIYPIVHDELCLFAQLTACRGTRTFWVEIRSADTDGVLFRSRTRTVTFPNDPLIVHGWPFRYRNLYFPDPGLYWVQLWCDDTCLTQQPLRLA